MLLFENVSYKYPGANDLALAEITFSVAPGEHVVLLGENGSGKSTIARLANGLLMPEEGRVHVNGLKTEDLTTIRELRSQIGVVVQDPDTQIISNTVLDEIAFGPENLGLERDEILSRVNGALAMLDLEGYEERDPNTLSGGEKQRVVIASMLAMNPSFLVLDEPTSRLDEKGRNEVRGAIKDLNLNGHGILHITHDLSFCTEAHKVIVIKAGKPVFVGTPNELLANEDLLFLFGLKISDNQMIEYINSTATKSLVNIKNALTSPEDQATTTISADHADVINPTDPRALTGKKSLLRVLLDALKSYKNQPYLQSAPKDREIRPESVQLKNVHFAYGQDATGKEGVLRGVNLGIGSGSYILISGKPGCGKSTLLRIIAGLLQPQEGSVLLSDDTEVKPGDVGIVFQNPEDQIFAQTVEEEIAFGLNNLGLLRTKEARGVVVRESLEAVGLDAMEYFARSPFALSGGERHRVAIASVLAMCPPIILLDEPTAGLDAKGRAFVHSMIEKMIDSSAGVVVVSHEIEEFKPRANVHLVLKAGRLWLA